MRTIWKLKLEIVDIQEFVLPKGTAVLHIGVQGTQPCMWVELDPEAEVETRKFMTVGTGHEVPENGTYRGSYCIGDGKRQLVQRQLVEPTFFVGHIYELI